MSCSAGNTRRNWNFRYRAICQPGKLLLFGCLSHGNHWAATPIALAGITCDCRLSRLTLNPQVSGPTTVFVASVRAEVDWWPISAFSRRASMESPPGRDHGGGLDCDREPHLFGMAVRGTVGRGPSTPSWSRWVGRVLSAVQPPVLRRRRPGEFSSGDGKLNYAPQAFGPRNLLRRQARSDWQPMILRLPAYR